MLAGIYQSPKRESVWLAIKLQAIGSSCEWPIAPIQRQHSHALFVMSATICSYSMVWMYAFVFYYATVRLSGMSYYDETSCWSNRYSNNKKANKSLASYMHACMPTYKNPMILLVAGIYRYFHWSASISNDQQSAILSPSLCLRPVVDLVGVFDSFTRTDNVKDGHLTAWVHADACR